MRARDNPFTVQRIHSIPYVFPEGDWGLFLQRLEKLDYRGAIVGPKGRGKSTLLRELGARLRERNLQPRFVRRDEDEPSFPKAFWKQFPATLQPGDVILFDGAEQLTCWAWRRFVRMSRAARGLVITSHRRGMLPLLYVCDTTPELLKEVIARIAPDEAPRLPLSAEELYSRHKGDLREALRELYDRYARKE